MGIKEDILAYTPFNEQEAADKEIILDFLNSGKDVFTRENKTAHFTASSWVVNPEHTKVLMAYHNIYNSWAWLGGHADGEKFLLAVALREAREESGNAKVLPVSPDILSLEIVPVSGHEKHGKYVSSHLHLNVTYLFEAPEDEELSIKPDENSGVAWIPFDEIVQKSTEPWFVERIYSKLIEKCRGN